MRGHHPHHVATQKTQVRAQLGSLIRRTRKQAGLKRQDDLAEATGLSVSVISLAERGAKVEPNTLTQIETALAFPAGSFEAYLAGGPEPRPAHHANRGDPNAGEPSLLTMSRTQLADAAAVVAEVYGEEAGDRFLRDALDKRAEANRTGERDQAG